MKINIKKFMEKSNIVFDTPSKIEAPHDGGKSTIFRAVLFAITGKDIDGKEFDGKIYPKNSTMLSDLFVEVEIEQNGIVFNKSAKGSEKRQKGSDETELTKNVNAVYSVNFKVVSKAEYEAEIKKVFGDFQLFCNPDYFKNLDKKEKRSIFANLVKIDKNSYFNGLADKSTVKGRIKEQNEKISNTNANLSEFSKVQAPEKIDVVDYSSKLAELRQQRQESTPELSFLQVTLNNEIRNKISTLEKSVFVPEKLIPLLPEIEKPSLIDVEDLREQLEKVQLSKPNTNVIDDRRMQFAAKISGIKALKLQIDNYDENVKGAKCTLCQVCSAPDCKFKRIEVTPIDELQNELSKLMTIEEAENSLQRLESEKIDYLRNFKQKKEDEILRLENKINESNEFNNSAVFAYESEIDQIKIKNKEVIEQNSIILSLNSKYLASFENDKAQKIAELKKQLFTLQDFDYTEIDEKIEKLVLLQKDQQFYIDILNKKIGSFEYAKERIIVLSEELSQLKQSLYKFERELIKIEDAENRYYSDFESKINNEMPENIKVSLFKKNISTEGYSEVFDIEFNGSIYAGNGKTIAFYIWLCNWFQSKFEKSLPIFIDEAIILNESLYSDVKNTVILMRNDDIKTLKIS